MIQAIDTTNVKSITVHSREQSDRQKVAQYRHDMKRNPLSFTDTGESAVYIKTKRGKYYILNGHHRSKACASVPGAVIRVLVIPFEAAVDYVNAGNGSYELLWADRNRAVQRLGTYEYVNVKRVGYSYAESMWGYNDILSQIDSAADCLDDDDDFQF